MTEEYIVAYKTRYEPLFDFYSYSIVLGEIKLKK
jgi:hypothetical protein